MTTQEILNLQTTKTEKIKLLLANGMTRKEVATAMGVGYGFVQNVYAKVYGADRPTQATLDYIGQFIFNRTFGVEIEACGVEMNLLKEKLNAAGIAAETQGYNHRTQDCWKIVRDGSVSGTNPFELVSPVLKGAEGIEELKTVCRVLKEAGAKINKSCGMHIHFGAADLKIGHWRNLFKNYAGFETTIDSFMPASRRGNENYFCKSMKIQNERIIDEARTLRELQNAVLGNSRYFKMNTQSYWRQQTVEFRQHSGTIEFEKISNWIYFLARLIDFSKRKATTADGFEAMAEFLPSEVKCFFERRAVKLAA